MAKLDWGLITERDLGDVIFIRQSLIFSLAFFRLKSILISLFRIYPSHSFETFLCHSFVLLVLHVFHVALDVAISSLRASMSSPCRLVVSARGRC